MRLLLNSLNYVGAARQLSQQRRLPQRHHRQSLLLAPLQAHALERHRLAGGAAVRSEDGGIGAVAGGAQAVVKAEAQAGSQLAGLQGQRELGASPAARGTGGGGLRARSTGGWSRAARAFSAQKGGGWCGAASQEA